MLLIAENLRFSYGTHPVLNDVAVSLASSQIVALISEAALPLFSIYSEYADEGGLMAYGPSLQAIYWRGATYVDRILKGDKPGEA